MSQPREKRTRRRGKPTEFYREDRSRRGRYRNHGIARREECPDNASEQEHGGSKQTRVPQTRRAGSFIGWRVMGAERPKAFRTSCNLGQPLLLRRRLDEDRPAID